MAFCTNCGNKLGSSDRFCGQCGHARSDQDADHSDKDVQPDAKWRERLSYHDVINGPDVQRALQVAASRSSNKLSTNELISLITPVLPGAGTSVLGVTSKIGFSIAASDSKWSAARKSTKQFPHPTGLVIGALACAFAALGHDVQDVREAQDSVTIEAKVSVTLLSAQFVVEAKITGSAQETRIDFALKSVGLKIFKWRERQFFERLDDEFDRYLLELSR